ncbi:hypothetical protein ABEB36_000174 [Hypothenemus hampei]|uniref:DUF4817 domain-containing protein n=1 Tax=Hypothenemus hampei TaxID=57062 RepID=A0ABD1FAF4_HYPHA
MVYTIAERVEIIYLFAGENRCALRAATGFNARHPDKNVSDVYKFEATGFVQNIKANQPRILNEVA